MEIGRRLIIRGGECGSRIRAIDWSKTELGPLKSWSQELLSIVNTVLNTPVATVLICHDGGHLIYNDGYAQFAGPKHPTILGQNYAVAWPEVADYNTEMCARVIAGETISYKERLLKLKRGDHYETVYCNLTYSPIFDAQGTTIATQVTVVDVTDAVTARQQVIDALQATNAERQIAEDALQLNRTITENASTALFILNDNFDCTFMNPAAVAMTGYTLKEVIKSGKSLHQLIHYAYPNGVVYPSSECPLNNALKGRRSVSADETFIRKDGTFYPINFTISPIVSEGKLISVILEVRDMTETEQLIELNQVKDDFIAMASHQLRTPATSVKQYLGIVMQDFAGPINSQQRQYLQTAYNANERQLSIIEDLLKTARIDTKGFKLKLYNMSVNSMISDAVKRAHPMLTARNQKLRMVLPKTVLKARLDRREFSVCLDNLIENASKYSSEGETITVTVKKLRQHVAIIIKDNGVGIARDDQKKIFEKFTRIDNSLSDTVSGNGLGLYWVKRVVDLHKGTIMVESELGVYTAITVRLPL